MNNKGHQTQLRNKSGKTGVLLWKTPKKGDFWRAYWFVEGKLTAKCFSIRRLGNDEAYRQAVAYREMKEREIGIEIRVVPQRPNGPDDITTELPPRIVQRKLKGQTD
jgi:hypothetical protein